jgi:hypothetical protein
VTRKLPPRDRKDRFTRYPKPPPLDPALVKALGQDRLALDPYRKNWDDTLPWVVIERKEDTHEP